MNAEFFYISRRASKVLELGCKSIPAEISEMLHNFSDSIVANCLDGSVIRWKIFEMKLINFRVKLLQIRKECL